jgi:hypothetical protein
LTKELQRRIRKRYNSLLKLRGARDQLVNLLNTTKQDNILFPIEILEIGKIVALLKKTDDEWSSEVPS